MHTFLTGGIQIGKSTIIKAVVDSLNDKKTAGFFTRWINKNNFSNAGLYMLSADPETISLLWDINTIEDPDSIPELRKYLNDDNLIATFESGNYKKKIVNTDVFDVLGSNYLKNATSADLIIIDEIGIFEDKAYTFKEEFDELLKTDIPILGTVQEKSGTLTDMVKSHANVDIVEVTRKNRDDIRKQLIKQLSSI